MKHSGINPRRVLAIDPTSRGFGFVVLESPATLVDWGVRSVKGNKEENTLARVFLLIQHYWPEILVIESHLGKRKALRFHQILDGIRILATSKGIKCRQFSLSRIKRVFKTFGASTKHEIAHAIAQQLPELAPRLPRRRRAWMSEDYRMAIFDAASLALTYFYTLPIRNSSETTS